MVNNVTEQNNNENTSSNKTETGGCLGLFIGLFLLVWAIVFVGLGINFVVQMQTAMRIQNECLNNGNCPTLQVQPDGNGGTIVRPTFPAK